MFIRGFVMFFGFFGCAFDVVAVVLWLRQRRHSLQQLSDVFAVGGSRWRATVCVVIACHYQSTLASDNFHSFLASPNGVATICAKLNCISGWSVRLKLQPFFIK
jgi:hypothetical protein